MRRPITRVEGSSPRVQKIEIESPMTMNTCLLYPKEGAPCLDQAKRGPKHCLLADCERGRTKRVVPVEEPNRMWLRRISDRSWVRTRAKLWLALVIAVTLFAGPFARAQFAYVASNGTDSVSGFLINRGTGALTPVAGSPFPAGSFPVSVAVHPTGKFVYVANNAQFSGGNGNVSGYTINPGTGTLTAIVGSPFPAELLPNSVTVDPSGKFAYMANQGNNVSGYAIDPSTGALTAIAGSPFAAGSTPVSVAVDPSGKFAYAANETSGNVSGYSIEPSTGALTAIAGSPFTAGSFPRSVVVDPSGKFAYVVNAFDGDVSGYRIDPNTGALTTIAGSPFPAGFFPQSVAVDPSGKFAYVANQLSANVSGYAIDPSTGALIAIAGSPFTAGEGPFSVAVDPSGKFAYVANMDSGTASGYTIDPNTGALTAVVGSPFVAGFVPQSVAITPLVPFASSFAKLEIKTGHRPGFHLKEFFRLATNSNGINPVTENLILQIGTFSVTIPSGSFEQIRHDRFGFEGSIDDVRLEVQIVPLGNNLFTFEAEGRGVDLAGLTNPVTVLLTIGIDSGTTTVDAVSHPPDDGR